MFYCHMASFAGGRGHLIKVAPPPISELGVLGITREILLPRKAAKWPNLRILIKPPHPKPNFGENLLCGFSYVYRAYVGVLQSVQSWGRWALTAASAHSAPSNSRKMAESEGFN